MIESAPTIARLKSGVSAQQAFEDAQSVFAHVDRKNGERDRHLAMRSYRDLVVGDMQKPLLTLLGGVGVLLLIACANAANLQIGRAANRMPEMKTRSALGASFGRLLQQLITESILVSLFGATLGGALSYAAIEAMRHAYGKQFPRFDELSVQPVVWVCTGVLAVLVGVIASIAPMLNIRASNKRAIPLQECYTEIAAAWNPGGASGCADVRTPGDQRPVCAYLAIAPKCEDGIRSSRCDDAGPHARAAEPGS